jgi:hypothetical protein
MNDVNVIFDNLVELRCFAERTQRSDLVSQVNRAENVALAEICADYYESTSDDYYSVMLQIFPEVYRCHA